MNKLLAENSDFNVEVIMSVQTTIQLNSVSYFMPSTNHVVWITHAGYFVPV